MTIKAKSLLQDDEVRLYNGVADLLVTEFSSRYMLLVKVQPSTFINPRDLPLEQQGTCYLGLITMTVTRRGDGVPVCAVLDARRADATAVADLLLANGIRCICVSFDNSLDDLFDQIRQAIKAQIRCKVTTLAVKGRPRSNGEQFVQECLLELQQDLIRASTRTRDLLREIYPDAERASAAVETPAIQIYPEACLSEFIDTTELLNSDLVAFARKSRVDVLVASLDDEITPLFAIEFDGAYHDLDDRVRRNDRKKDELFSGSGVPLVRIRQGDMPVKLQRTGRHLTPVPEGNLEKLQAEVYVDAFKLMLRRFCNLRDLECREARVDARISKHRDAIFSDRLATQRAAGLVDRSNIDKVFEEIDAEIEAKFSEAWMDEQSDYRGQQYLVSNGFGDEIRDEQLALRQARIADVQLAGDGKNKRINAVLISAECEWEISLPAVCMNLVGKFPTFMKMSFGEFADTVANELLGEFCLRVLRDEGVAPAITDEDLRAYKRHATRPWLPHEKDALRERRADSLASRADCFERTQHDLYCKECRIDRTPIDPKRSRELARLVVEDAIRFYSQGKRPTLPRLV